MNESVAKTGRFLPIRRVPGGTSLLSTGVLVETIDNEIPTLYDCLCKILEPQMIQSEWERLSENVPLFQHIKKGSCVFILSEKALQYYNCLISNVHTSEEKTGLIKLIYTDDDEFNVRAIPRITKESQFEKIKSGMVSYIKPDKTYVIRVSTDFISGVNRNIKESVIDYLFYIPADSIFKG